MIREETRCHVIFRNFTTRLFRKLVSCDVVWYGSGRLGSFTLVPLDADSISVFGNTY